jgi:hypothetical protein
MDIWSLFALLVLSVLVWYWLHSIRILELARDDNGRRILRRTYRFEFSETGNNRREGAVIMLGERVESVTLEPYQILE